MTRTCGNCEKFSSNGGDCKRSSDPNTRPREIDDEISPIGGGCVEWAECDNDQVPETRRDIEEAASYIMQNCDPVSFILDVHQTVHIGDRNTAETCLLSIGAQGAKNTGGIQPKVSGQTAKGKTHCVRAMAHLTPSEWMMETTLSDKALFYIDIPAGGIVFSDDVNLTEGMTGLIKRSTSNFQAGDTYTTLDRQLKPVTLTIPPRLVFWLTSVDDDDQMQLLNRQFGGGVDESADQDKRVAEFQLMRAAAGLEELPENDDVLVCREIIKVIKQNLFTVVIPFTNRITWKDCGNRRNLTIFLDMIMAYAVLRQKGREINSRGELIATTEDFEDAKRLYSSRAELQGLKLTDQERKCCRIIVDAGQIEAQHLQRALNVSKVRLSQIIHGKSKKNESGMAFKLPNLFIDKKSERIGDDTVNKTYYSLHDFNAFELYDNVVDLKPVSESGVNPGLPEVNPQLTHYLPYIYNNKINNSRHDKGKKESEVNPNAIVQRTEINTENESPISLQSENRVNLGKLHRPIANQKVNSGLTPGLTPPPDSGCSGLTPLPDSENTPSQKDRITSLRAAAGIYEKQVGCSLNSQNYKEFASRYVANSNRDYDQVLTDLQHGWNISEPGKMDKLGFDQTVEPVTTIRALRDIPVFAGRDGTVYELKAEDIRAIPQVNAMALINRKVAVEVPGAQA